MGDPICEMIDIIEHFTGSQVISIGNGPKGDEIVYIKRTASSESSKKQEKKKEKVVKRIDPDDGVAYTWEQLRKFYSKTFKEKDIKAYWERECKPVKNKGKAKKRTR